MSTRIPLNPFSKSLHVWAPDALEKIFRHSKLPARARKSVALDAARGEVVSGQIALRTHDVKMHGYGIDAVTIEPLRSADRRNRVRIPVERRWVGYTFVPAASGIPGGGVDPSHLEGRAPGLYPDPLYPVCETATYPHHLNPDHSAALGMDRTLALWLTVRVPREAPAGCYEGAVRFRISFYGSEVVVPIRVTVYSACLPARPTCGVENWFALASVVRHHECDWWSARFWELVGAYLRNMADHRQTHIVVPMFELIGFRPKGRNGVALDWTRFDRFVRMALEAGLTTLVGNHLATYTYHLENRVLCGVHTFRNRGGKVVHELHDPFRPEARAWLAWFLPRLRQHLKQRGWLGRWWQHIRDEPASIREQYEAVRSMLKRHAPEFRTIDALHGPIVEACDCWVPSLDSWGANLDFFRQRQAAGDRVWTYVCCGPVGKYANRFVDQKTVLPRLIFWIMARYGATGYLHWGYNWSDTPVPEADSTWFLPAQGPVQSGDTCIVYPGPHGPHDSIRWEMQREGLQEYELLMSLSPKARERLASRLVRGFADYDTGTDAFRAVRRAVLKEVARNQGRR